MELSLADITTPAEYAEMNEMNEIPALTLADCLSPAETAQVPVVAETAQDIPEITDSKDYDDFGCPTKKTIDRKVIENALKIEIEQSEATQQQLDIIAGLKAQYAEIAYKNYQFEAENCKYLHKKIVEKIEANKIEYFEVGDGEMPEPVSIKKQAENFRKYQLTNDINKARAKAKGYIEMLKDHGDWDVGGGMSIIRGDYLRDTTFDEDPDLFNYDNECYGDLDIFLKIPVSYSRTINHYMLLAKSRGLGYSYDMMKGDATRKLTEFFMLY